MFRVAPALEQLPWHLQHLRTGLRQHLPYCGHIIDVIMGVHSIGPQRQWHGSRGVAVSVVVSTMVGVVPGQLCTVYSMSARCKVWTEDTHFFSALWVGTASGIL